MIIVNALWEKVLKRFALSGYLVGVSDIKYG